MPFLLFLLLFLCAPIFRWRSTPPSPLPPVLHPPLHLLCPLRAAGPSPGTSLGVGGVVLGYEDSLLFSYIILPISFYTK